MHHFTVDVEEYFQVSAFDGLLQRTEWERQTSRVVDSTRRMLDVMEEYPTRGTFFVLGWIAERFPDLVREIQRRGHELASHGWDHRRVTHQRPEEFRTSVRDTKSILEGLTGVRVLGFRAPSFSIVPGGEWALSVLQEEGYAYDSSLYPVRRPGYGYPGAAEHPHRLNAAARQLIEVPPATLPLLGARVPAGGGAYLRLLPYQLVSTALRECERRGYPGTFYTHPWEIDPGQPRLAVPWLTRLRHYGGLHRTEPRIRRLLSEFRFDSIASSLDLDLCG